MERETAAQQEFWAGWVWTRSRKRGREDGVGLIHAMLCSASGKGLALAREGLTIHATSLCMGRKGMVLMMRIVIVVVLSEIPINAAVCRRIVHIHVANLSRLHNEPEVEVKSGEPHQQHVTRTIKAAWQRLGKMHEKRSRISMC